MNDYSVNPERIVSSWLRIFLAMSINQFEEFADVLNFPIGFSEELSLVAKEFSLLALSSMNISIPEEPLDTVILALAEEENDPLPLFWEHIFSRLESMGYAEFVYKWGLQMQNDQMRFGDRMATASDWDALLIHWTQDPSNLKTSFLTLESEKIKILRSVVSKYYIEYQQLKLRVENIEQNSTDKWVIYVLGKMGISAWLKNEIWFHLQLLKWKEILGNLSDEETKNFNDWGYKNIMTHYSGNSFFSVIDLARELTRSDS